MTLALDGERSEDPVCHSLDRPSQVPKLKLSALQADNPPATSSCDYQDTRRPSLGSNSLPPVYSSTAREHLDEKAKINSRGGQTARIRFAPPPRSKQRKSVCPSRAYITVPPANFCEQLSNLELKRATTAHSFRALETWLQSTESGVLKNLLTEVHDVLFDAIYWRPEAALEVETTPSASSLTSELSMNNGNVSNGEKHVLEYFSIVSDVQEKVKLQRQERKQLMAQLDMEKSVELDLSMQLQQLERELAQLHMYHAYNRAEIEGERLAVQHLEKDYAAITEEEQELQQDCEVLELQLDTQRAQLKEIRSQQLYLDFVSSAPLKRHMEEKKWQEQHAAVALQVQNAEAENRALEDKIRKLEDETVNLEAQYEHDVQTKQQSETTLSEIRANFDQFQEAFEQTRVCYTPRPDWDRIVDETPELSVQKYQWEMVDKTSSRDVAVAENEEENDKDKCGVLEGLGDSTNNLAIKDDEEQSSNNGRTKTLVKEMLHWIERLQKHCGVNLHLSRVSAFSVTFFRV